jgi:NADPH:quinone reductase
MHAIVIRNYGGPENLVIQDIPEPEPKAGHIIVEVKAFGINRAEMYFREGAWGDIARVSGIECVGQVKSDPSGLMPVGQKVIALMGGMGRTIDGSYADFVSVPSEFVVAIDTEMPWEELAAIPESYATAWTCLFRNIGLKSGQTILIRGATSALGQAAINIANHAGARVLATTRKKDRFESIANLGAEPILENAELSPAIRDLGNGGVDAVLDIVGNSTILDSLAMTKADGKVCLVGFLGGGEPIAEFDPLTQMPSGVHLSFFASAFAFGTPDYPLSDIPFQDIADRVGSGAYKAKPARVFNFEQIANAHRFMESDEANGKIVVRGP